MYKRQQERVHQFTRGNNANNSSDFWTQKHPSNLVEPFEDNSNNRSIRNKDLIMASVVVALFLLLLFMMKKM